MQNVVGGSENLVLITIWNARRPKVATGQPASKVPRNNLLRIVDHQKSLKKGQSEVSRTNLTSYLESNKLIVF